MRRLALFLVAGLAACGPTPEEKAAADARDVAEVEAHQSPPPDKFVPDPISFADVEAADMFGAGCSVLPKTVSADGIAIAVAQAHAAYFKRKGEVVRLSADAGSKELPYLARTHYDGLEYSMTLELDEDAGVQSGDETVDYPSVLTIKDAEDRAIFTDRGTTQCGA